MDDRPIGIFDSGVGGLTFIKQFVKVLPSESFIYFGDSKRMPYGLKNKDYLINCLRQSINFLSTFNVKMVVSACVTISGLIDEVVLSKLAIPLIGVIGPSVSKALKLTKNKRIALIGTKSTINRGEVAKQLHETNPEVIVYSQPCPLMASLAENGEAMSSEGISAIERYIKPFRYLNIDTMILGCTHFSLMQNTIRRSLGKEVNFIDPGLEAAFYVENLLKSTFMQAKSNKASSNIFYVSGNLNRFKEIGSKILPEFHEELKVIRVDIDNY